MTLHKIIVLVGMMGAGKTSVGKRLAKYYGAKFRDADAEIEKAAGMSVADIFAHYGQADYRALEKRVIARLLVQPPHVLAFGGGAFIDADTRALVKTNAVSIWLKTDPAILLQRIRRTIYKRPNLRDDPEAAMVRLLREREPIYALADVMVETYKETVDSSVSRVVVALEAYNKVSNEHLFSP